MDLSSVATSSLDDIIAELDRDCRRKLPESAIRAAQQRREEITPRLIDLIRKATDAVRSGAAPGGDGHLFALYLLTEFRAKAALPAILEALSLPGEGPFDLFGDAVTEDVCRVLAALAESPDLVDGLIANRSLNLYVRWEAAHTCLLFVRDGRLTREQAVERLRTHLRDAIANREDEMASALVWELEPYAPHEAVEEIRAAFRMGLVHGLMIGMEDIDGSISAGRARFEESLASCRPTGVRDTVEELRGWAAFQEKPAQRRNTDVAPTNIGPRAPDVVSGLAGPRGGVAREKRIDPRSGGAAMSADTIRHALPRVGRNDPCPCGSGKKFKKCCGAG